MAAERERRVNAGRNISKLIEQEITGDEFYQTAYGGFEEASEDEEYQVSIQVLFGNIRTRTKVGML